MELINGEIHLKSYSIKIEFKEMFTDKIYCEVIAFANSDGGVIFVGIDSNGNIVGLYDVDGTYTRITNGKGKEYTLN